MKVSLSIVQLARLPKYATKFIEMCLMVTADHGPAVSGAHNAIVCTRAGKDLVSALASGLLTIVSKLIYCHTSSSSTTPFPSFYIYRSFVIFLFYRFPIFFIISSNSTSLIWFFSSISLEMNSDLCFSSPGRVTALVGP